MNTVILSQAVSLLALLVLHACGGGGGGSATSPPTSSNIINGLVVPPDPGVAANITIAGIDSNNNGIRDEIDRFIATKYGGNSNQVVAAQVSASANSGLMESLHQVRSWMKYFYIALIHLNE